MQERVNGTGKTTTIYVGSAYEVVTHSDGLVEEKCHILTPQGRTATRTARNDATFETRYYHQDGLGSIVAVSDELGRVEQRFAFDPWGKRLTLLNQRDRNGGEITRGFTDHEHLDDFGGLINMNGRIFDPALARFLSADPMLSDAGNSQSYNRYSYVENKPLNATDPSGYNLHDRLSNWLDKNAGQVVLIIMCVEITVLSGGLGFWGAVAGAAASGFIGSYVSTSEAGGSLNDAFKAGLKDAAISALTAAASYGIGAYFKNAKTGIWANGTVKWAGRTLSQAAVRGLAEDARGGEFRHGFYTTLLTEGLDQGSGPPTIVQVALIGGTISEMNDGKFTNGALTTAGIYVAVVLISEIGNSLATINSMSSKDTLMAKLSKDIYNPNPNGVDGWRMTKDDKQYLPWKKDSMYAAVYTNGTDFVLVYRGSIGDWGVWGANFLQALGFKSSLFADGINYAKKMSEKYGDKLEFTGHSLGGGLAAAAAIATGGHATTFNASGLNYNTISGYDPANAFIIDYRSSFDILFLINAYTPVNAFGPRVPLGYAGLHGIAGLVDALGTP